VPIPAVRLDRWLRSPRSSRSPARVRCVGRSTTPFRRRCARASASARCSSCPFGRRELLGVVVGSPTTARSLHDRLRAPRSERRGGRPADLVELAGWIALEYCSTPSRALSLVLAPGAGAGVHARPARRRADRRRSRERPAGGAADRRCSARCSSASRRLGPPRAAPGRRARHAAPPGGARAGAPERQMVRSRTPEHIAVGAPRGRP
jgi:primosomal protein N' (replication factor Y)